ncbi:hypothetical protein Hdeb2414_s0008g00280891 [Helianthus debilis subsp. tardiflorus]
MYRASFGEDVSSNKNPEAAVTSLDLSSQKGGDCKLMEVVNEHGK